VLALQYFRLQQHLSQSKLAFLAETHQAVISLCEKGELIPDASTRERLASALRVSPEVLLVEVVVPQPAPKPTAAETAVPS
jgi:transcriptional regulator with XRE-family HTH domain